MPRPLWKPLGGTPETPVTIRNFQGVNKLDAFSIQDGFFTDVKNVTSADYPAVSVRPGTSTLGTTLGGAVVGLGVWKDTELISVANATMQKWGGSSWGTALSSSLSSTARWSFCNFQGELAAINLIGGNGVDTPKKYNGTTVTALGDAPATGNYFDQHNDRVYCAVGNDVNYSAGGKAEDWTTADDAGSITVETPDGETINGLKAGPGHVVVFKNHSTNEIYGTGPSNYRTVSVSNKVGCTSNATAVMVNGYLNWLSHRGIERYAGDLPPDNTWSLPVQWYIDNINDTYRSLSCAGTNGNNYYLAIPLSAATEPSHIIEYDPRFGTFYVWEMVNNPRNFAYMAEAWYYGDSAGLVKQITGTADTSTAVSWYVVSKPFGSGTLAQRKQWYDLWVVVDLPSGSTLTAYLTSSYSGDDDWTSVKTFTASSAIQSTRVVIPVDTVANANWIRYKLSGTGPCTIYEIDRREREMLMV